MRKFLLIALCVLLMVPSLAFAAGKATIEQEKVYLFKGEYSSYTYATTFLEVVNTGDKAIEMDQGTFEVFDANGDVMDDTSLYSFFPKFVEPGESCYVSAYIMLSDKEPKDVDDYSIQVSSKSAKVSTQYLKVVDAKLIEVPSYPGSDRMTTKLSIVVENDTAETLYDISAAAGAYDADGKLLFCVSGNEDFGLLPGSQAEFRLDVDETATAALDQAADPDSGMSLVKNIKALAFVDAGW